MTTALTPIFTDHHIQHLAPDDVVCWMRDAIRAQASGELLAPARTQQQLSAGKVVFTVGELRGQWYGYRVYDTVPNGANPQLVVVHDQATGIPLAMHTGELLGPTRVGGIGAVAVDVLAQPTVAQVAVVGAGVQAWHQLWAMRAVRRVRLVTVFCRDVDRRRAFARRVTRELGVSAVAAESAQECVAGAQVVVLATNSPTPVVDAAWLASGALVTSVGPKNVGRSEFDEGLIECAGLMVTDSLAQLEAYDPPHMAQGQRVVELGSLMTSGGCITPSSAGDVTVFFSVGLAGTEPFLLHRMWAHSK